MSDPTGPHGQRRRYSPVDSLKKYNEQAAQRIGAAADSLGAGSKAGAQKMITKADSSLAKADKFQREATDSAKAEAVRKKYRKTKT